MNITIRQLKIFEAVSRLKSFSHAAKTIHLTQPAVTKQIKALETEFEVELFTRDTKRLELTQAGMTLLEESYNIFEALHGLEMEMRQYANNVSATLHLSINNVIKRLIFEYCFAFKKQHPDVEISVMVYERHKQLKHLDDSHYDLIIMPDNADVANVNEHVLHREQLVFLAAPEHPLLEQDKLTFLDLVRYPLLIGEYDSSHRRLLEDCMLKYNVPSPEFIQIGHNEAVAQAVMAGLGIGYLTQDIVKYELDAGVLKILPVADEVNAMIIKAFYAKSHALPDVALEFLQFIDALHTEKSHETGER